MSESVETIRNVIYWFVTKLLNCNNCNLFVYYDVESFTLWTYYDHYSCASFKSKSVFFNNIQISINFAVDIHGFQRIIVFVDLPDLSSSANISTIFLQKKRAESHKIYGAHSFKHTISFSTITRILYPTGIFPWNVLSTFMLLD